MAREVSLGELKARARFLSDTVNDTTVTELELNASANTRLCEVYDRLVDSGPADYYAATTQIVTSPGFIEYPLHVDFRNLVAVYVRESTDERRQLLPMPEMARGRFKSPSGVWTLDVEFIPVPTPLEDDGDAFDGVSGWDELIANYMAQDIMTNRESDPSVVMSNIARLEARINSRAKSRDRAGKRVTDMDELMARPYGGWASSSRLSCYRLRAGNLELFEDLWGLP